jgi:hypothetical protein
MNSWYSLNLQFHNNVYKMETNAKIRNFLGLMIFCFTVFAIFIFPVGSEIMC